MDFLLPEICEKENVQHSDMVKPEPCHPPLTPLRTPLQDVDHNCQTSRMKPSYVQITPVSSKTPRRRSRLEPLLPVFQDEQDQSKENIPINSLVYKKVIELVSKARQEYEEKLSVKDQVINDLREQLSGVITQGVTSTSVRIIPPTPVTDADDDSSEIIPFNSNQASYTLPQLDLSLIYRDTESSAIFLSPSYKPADANTETKSSNTPKKSDSNALVANNSLTGNSDDISDVFGLEHLDNTDFNTNDNVILEKSPSDNCKLSKLTEFDLSDSAEMCHSNTRQDMPVNPSNCLLNDPTYDHDYSVKPTSNVTMVESIVEEIYIANVSPGTIDTSHSDPCNPDHVECYSQVSTLREQADACCSPILKSSIADASCSPIQNDDFWNSCVDRNVTASSVAKDASTMKEAQIPLVDIVGEICTATPSKSESTAQCQPTMTSVMCSPFLIDTKEFGFTANIQVLANDVTTETERCAVLEKEVDVRPELNTTHTMTEKPLLMSCETSMTPVKLHNKFGKRLTAEEVRKQHPRAVANQLDTMSVCASRLQGEVGHLEKERNHLRLQVRDLRKNIHQKEESLNNLEEQKEEEKMDILDKCSKLEAELVEKEELRKVGDMSCDQWRLHCAELESEMDKILEAHQKEIRSVREELEMNNYRPHFEHSQRLVQELKAEMAEFADIGENLRTAEKLQEEVRNAFSGYFVKVNGTQRHFLAVSKGLQTQQADVTKQQKENEAMAEKLRVEREEMLEDNADRKRTMEMCRQNIVQLEGLYNSTSSDLLSATTQVCLLNKELITCRKSCAEAVLSERTVASQLEELDKNDKVAFLEIQTLQASMTLQQRELDKATKRYVELQTDFLQKQKELRKNKEEYDLVTFNMQRTLDSFEQDIEIQEKDLYECRELIIEQRDKLDILEPTEGENCKLRAQCTDLQKTVDELRESLRMTEEELSVTKDHASRLILQQGAELRDCNMAVQDLSSRMKYVLTTLRTKVGLQAEKEENVSENRTITAKEDACSQTLKAINNRKSLVSLVLAAADRETDVAEVIYQTGRDSIESPATVSRNQLGSSAASAFQPVKSCRVNFSEDSSEDKAKACSSCEPLANESCEQSPAVADQINLLCETLKEIIRMANILEQASKLSIQDLKSENSDVVVKLDHYQHTQRRNDATLHIKKEQLTQAEQTITEMRHKMELMSENLNRFSDQEYKIRALEDETLQLKHQVTTLESEKELLSCHLEEIIQRGDEQQTDDVRVLKAKYDRDILAFKKKIQKLRDHLWEKEEHYDAVGNKASKRMDILKDNWQKAEAEVHRLDSLIESIRENLVNNEEDRMKPGTFQKLLKIIDGLDHVEAKPTGKENQPLQVIPTASGRR